MKKTVCIYPEDPTTDFLLPLYEHICNSLHAAGTHTDTTEEDDSLDKIYEETKDADVVIFLGHGTSKMLYGSGCANVVFEESNCHLLNDKKLFLLACNSDQFIRNYKLTNAIGFGFLPTSIDDVRQTKHFHGINVEDFERADIDSFNVALICSLINTLSEQTLSDFHLFKERFRFNISREIACRLLGKETSNYRTVADELYYVFKDLIIS